MGLEAFHRSGQTFLTWELLDGDSTSYRIYRSEEPIISDDDLLLENLVWEVEKRSALNLRKTEATDTLFTFCIVDTVPLALTTGLFVHTTIQNGDFYYAVTSVSDGLEDTTIVFGEGGNSLSIPVSEEVRVPQPVLQYEGITIQGIPIRDYVHWGTNVDTDSIGAWASYPSFPYNFRVWKVPDDTSTVILRFSLHSGEQYFTQRGRANDEGMVVITPDCPKRTSPLSALGKTYWFGYNNNFGFADPLTDGVNVNYHERRLIYLKEWAVKNLHADPGAVHITGGSYGACGAVTMALSHPDEISSIIVNLPKLDFSDTTFMDFGVIQTEWGRPEDHIMTSDSLDTFERLDATWVIETFGHERDFPVMTMFFGRNDSVMGWPEKVEFMKKAQEMRIGGFYFWDMSAHGLAGPRKWGAELAYRFTTLFRFRSDESYPAVSGLSINDDPGDGDPAVGDSVGTYGGYIEWIPETIVDEERFYEVEIGLTTLDTLVTLPADTATAVVTLRRLQNFGVHSDSAYYFVNTDTTTGTTIQTSFVEPDSFGLLSVEGVVLSVNGQRLSYSPASDYVRFEAVARESVVATGDTAAIDLAMQNDAQAPLDAALRTSLFFDEADSSTLVLTFPERRIRIGVGKVKTRVLLFRVPPRMEPGDYAFRFDLVRFGGKALFARREAKFELIPTN